MLIKKVSKKILGLLLSLSPLLAYGVEIITSSDNTVSAINALSNNLNNLSNNINNLGISVDNSLINMQQQMTKLFQGYLGLHNFNETQYADASYLVDQGGNSTEKMSHLRGTLKGLIMDYYQYMNSGSIPAGGTVADISIDEVDTNTKLKLTMTDTINARKLEILEHMKEDNLATWPESKEYDYQLIGYSNSTEIGKISIYDLLDVNGYDKDSVISTISSGKKARTFISELLKSVPNLTEVVFNDKLQAIIIPLENDEGDTTTKLVLKDEYSDAKSFLEQDTIYKKYLNKISQLTKLRSIFTETFINSYQERVRMNVNNVSRSLVERETEMANRGLDQEYYENMKNKSAAEVNLEMLYALNKNAYFLHRLHRDNEKIRILISTIALKVFSKSAVDDIEYLKPMKVLIEHECWKNENKSSDYCKNPKSAAITDTGAEIDQETLELFNGE